ncbi:hypothetical protein GF373_00990, partial [bacterium]|nr:hypothetical protein [bacterium]
IGTVLDDGPAQKAGLRKGAQITEINGEPVNDWLEVIMGIQESLYVNDQGDYSANPISLTWLTPEQEMKQETITPEVKQRNILTPTSMETGKKYAMAQLGINRQSDRKKMGLVGSIAGGWNTFIYKCQFMVDFIGRLFTGQVSRKLLGGPIAIFQLSGETGRWGMERFLDFIALLSANLGLLNLFPLPPLDGAHIIFYSYEIVRRKKMTMKQMENFGKIGFLLIIPLFLWIIFNDLDRLNFFSWSVNLFQ